MKQKQYKCCKHLFNDLNFELDKLMFFIFFKLPSSILRPVQSVVARWRCVFLKPRVPVLSITFLRNTCDKLIILFQLSVEMPREIALRILQRKRCVARKKNCKNRLLLL